MSRDFGLASLPLASQHDDPQGFSPVSRDFGLASGQQPCPVQISPVSVP